jgi:HD superfamily phosphohydrolase
VSRAIRDPIHGNIPIKDVTGAVIDTLAFQRLRYVRQNGLLHFVFPGATHTRFAHSIGAMHVASRVWEQLARNFEPSKQRDYVGMVFELAALLHDVGHCAFSHSIESIKINGAPLLGSVKDVFDAWKEPELLKSYLKAAAKQDKNTSKTIAEIGDGAIKHEQIGLILAKRIFLTESKVSEVCEASLGVSGAGVGADVIALMQLGMPATSHLKKALASIGVAPSKRSCVSAKPREFVRDMLPVLAGLISGTLDVDRMDYLLRDSFYCGVSYGRIDIEHIIAGLGVATFKDRTYLTIKEKAVLAVDDLLWSRHQMFLQVYGHKTNVALNRTLQLALPEGMGDVKELNPPRSYPEYLEFSDDFVLSKIFSLCFHEKRLGEKSYARLLARREVPEHLGELRLPTATSDPESPEMMAERDRLANERGVDPSKVLFALSDNEIIKKGLLPRVLVENSSGGFGLESYESRSSLFPSAEGAAPPLPARYATIHFFIDGHDTVQAADPIKDGSSETISPEKIEKLPKRTAAGTTKKK